MPRGRDRLSAFRFGLDAEFWAASLLRLKGYRILETRFRAANAEIDLIVRRGRTLVFVEVKARATLAEAAEALRHGKIDRIARGARAYLTRLPEMPETIRCDAVLIAPGALPRHLLDIGELRLD